MLDKLVSSCCIVNVSASLRPPAICVFDAEIHLKHRVKYHFDFDIGELIDRWLLLSMNNCVTGGDGTSFGPRWSSR